LGPVGGSGKKGPPGQFYARRWAIYAALGVPEVDIATYRLRVAGLVEQPLALTYDELAHGPLVTLTRDFHCVTKWSIADVVWEGVPMRALAQRARVKPEAQSVMFTCLEGYTTAIPAEDALVEDAMVAVRLNGRPLSLDQGYPARPFVPHLYGWKSAKWLQRIDFRPSYTDGYWEMYGYHERGNVWDEERFKGQGGHHLPHRGLGTRPL
jgi:DMSO/TMAO reductase YedYZ molybdopterin-dependent catalytic subunit